MRYVEDIGTEGDFIERRVNPPPIVSLSAVSPQGPPSEYH